MEVFLKNTQIFYYYYYIDAYQIWLSGLGPFLLTIKTQLQQI